MNWIILTGILTGIFIIGSIITIVLTIKDVGYLDWFIFNIFWYVVWGFLLLFLWLIPGVNRANMKTNLIAFHNTRQMIELVIESGSEYDNIAISNAIIEKNTWLTEAKAGRERWGNWSLYPKEVDNMEYIVIPKNETTKGDVL